MVDLKQFADRPARILVVKLSSLGDVIHVTGALRALRRALPRAEITLVVEGRWADVVRHNPNVDGVIESSAQSGVPLSYLREIRGRLAGCRFDAALDFQGNRRSAAWVYLSGARAMAGRGGFRPLWKYAAEFDRTRHAVTVCGEVCKAMGVRAENFDPEIHTSRADEERLDAVLDAERLPRRGYVLVNPFSRWESKSWPVEGVREFVRAVQGSCAACMILTGGPEELGRAVPGGAAEIPEIASLVGRLTLGEALCLFRRASLMVTCDSGPMHAAAAFGVPVIALFGPTHPEHSGPWCSNLAASHVVLQARRPESHHAYRTDPQGVYMRALDSQRVVEAFAAKWREIGALAK